MKTIILALLSMMLFVSPPSSKSVTGKWKTIDDETGKAKSIVLIYKKTDGKLYGKITQLFRTKDQDQNPKCTKCTGNKKNKPIIGMEIITGLKKDGKEWYADNGILDPAKGKVYDCKLWVDEEDPNKLRVRGYVGWIYRTQTWKRVK